MKEGNVIVFGADDLITKSLGKKFNDVSFRDLYQEKRTAAFKADFVVYSDGVNFSIIKDRWGIGWLGLGSAGR